MTWENYFVQHITYTQNGIGTLHQPTKKERETIEFIPCSVFDWQKIFKWLDDEPSTYLRNSIIASGLFSVISQTRSIYDRKSLCHILQQRTEVTEHRDWQGTLFCAPPSEHCPFLPSYLHTVQMIQKKTERATGVICEVVSPTDAQMLSIFWLSATLWTVACQAPLPWHFPHKNIGVGCHFLLQGIFPTQGLNLGLLHCRQILYSLSHQESPKYEKRV